MAFTGTHVRSLDEKHRLAIPKPFRDALCTQGSATIVIAPETEQALSLYSEAQFQEQANEIRARTSTGQDARVFLRLYFSQAASVDVDRQGRIRIPDRLREFAGLQQEVILLGVNDHVEVWDQQRWDAFLENNGQSFDQIARQV